MAKYVDEKELREEIKIYQEAYEKIKPELPYSSEKIGVIFLKMAKRIASKPNFHNYTNIEDMQQDAVTKCVDSIIKFNLDLKTSSFSYFSQIIFMSFLENIGKLKKRSKEIPISFIETIDKEFFIEDDKEDRRRRIT